MKNDAWHNNNIKFYLTQYEIFVIMITLYKVGVPPHALWKEKKTPEDGDT